jgi:hypothetical protein
MDSRSSRRYESSNSRNESNNSHRREQLSIPPMRYKLTKLTQAQTLYQIAMRTSGFYDMSVNSADWVQRDVRSREFSSYGSLKAPEDMKLVDIITGEDDYYLKLTTKKHDVDYICYDREDNKFEFWGEYQCCVRSMNELRYRIEKVTLREGAKQYPVSNGCASNQYDDEGERDPYSRDPYPRDDSYARDSHGRDSYFRDDSYGRDEYDCDSTFETPKKQEQYSKFASTQMSKMGFQPSYGLGRNNTGRVAPIDPVTDLGGRTGKNNFGLGFGGLIRVDQDGVVRKVEEESLASSPPPAPTKAKQPQSDLLRSMSICPQEELPRCGLSRSMSCTYYDEEPPSTLMSELSIVAEEEEQSSMGRSMSITAD